MLKSVGCRPSPQLSLCSTVDLSFLRTHYQVHVVVVVVVVVAAAQAFSPL
jgi:hypothetical protein